MKGIDIYEGDNVQYWDAVKASGIEVVIQKATQGTSHVDSLLQYRCPRIKEAGLKIGFYHFAQFNSADPVSEAQHFLNTLAGLEGDTVLWLDIEAAEKWNKQTAIDYANAFINYVRDKGFQIGIYTGESFYHEYLAGNIPDVPLWLASYGRQPSLYPSSASWQYSESGQLDGVIGNVDLDYFIDNIFVKRKDEKELKNIVAHTGGIADAHSSDFLGWFLNCPVIDLSVGQSVDFSKIENVYFVGGGTFPTVANSKIIKGNDRYDTCIEVLKNIGKLK